MGKGEKERGIGEIREGNLEERKEREGRREEGKEENV